MASVFSPKYKVPVNIIAETPALRKKTNSIRGLAGQRRKKAIIELRKQKVKITRKLDYMDRPEPRRAAEPEPAEPPTVAAVPEPPPAAAVPKFVIPEASVPSSDEEVLIDIFSPFPLLTVARARLLLRPRLVRGGRNARPIRSLSLKPAVSRIRPSVKIVRVVLPALPARRSAPSVRVMCRDPQNELPIPQGSDRRKASSTSSGRRGGPK